MSKTEILEELPKLTLDELAEVRTKLDELTGDGWLESAGLSDEDKAALDAALAEHERNPDAVSSWEEVRARIEAEL